MVHLGFSIPGEAWLAPFCALGVIVGLGCTIGNIWTNRQIKKGLVEFQLALQGDAEASYRMRPVLDGMRLRYLYDSWDIFGLCCRALHQLLNLSYLLSGFQGLKDILRVSLPNLLGIVVQGVPAILDWYNVELRRHLAADMTIEAAVKEGSQKTADVMETVMQDTKVASGVVIGINFLGLMFYGLEFRKAMMRTAELTEDLESAAAELQNISQSSQTRALS